MWGALLAATCAGWLHQLTATTQDGRLVVHGVRGGQAMIATLRWRLLAVPARLIRHARSVLDDRGAEATRAGVYEHLLPRPNVGDVDQ